MKSMLNNNFKMLTLLRDNHMATYIMDAETFEAESPFILSTASKFYSMGKVIINLKSYLHSSAANRKRWGYPFKKEYMDFR